MSDEQNPFDALGLDPGLPREEITRILRERVETAPADEREEIARLWRELTMHESKRLAYALFAHPRSQPWEEDDIESLREAVSPIVVRLGKRALVSTDDAPAPLPPPRRPLFE